VRRTPLRIGLAVGAAVALALGVYLPTSARSSAAATLIDVPIRFTVRDVNRTPLHCPTSGRTYTVEGRLVAPASGIGSAATLYLSGVIFSGLFEFHNDLVPGYNFTRELAKLGHTSVVIDRLGYGKTRPYPRDGRSVCLGALADSVHQVITALRTGRYSAGGDPKAFRRVAVGAYSLGGVIAELEQASFRDQSALALISWADQGFSNFGTAPSYVVSSCSPGRAKAPGGTKGYLRVLPPEKVPPLLSRAADPRMVATFRSHEELDPCGQQLTGYKWFTGLAQMAWPRITIPVLVIYGHYDVLFKPSAWLPQWAHFTGTRDRTLIGIPDGQMLMLDRHVPLTRRLLSGWLAEHGL
jgi:pimeloyl-ACP methyl ester carboxylesterase